MYITAKDLTGGGTADASALSGTIGYIEKTKQVKGRVKAITVVVIVTDGEGEIGKLKPLFTKTENLENTFFLVVGAGDGTEGVISSWGDLKGAPITALQIKDKDMANMPIVVGDKITKILEDNIYKL